MYMIGCIQSLTPEKRLSNADVDLNGEHMAGVGAKAERYRVLSTSK
jgi:hypothetical protein